MLKRTIFIIMFPLALFAVHFASENVEIILEGDGFLRVEADYTYLLEGDCARKIPVLFPVPGDSSMALPDSIVVVFAGDTIFPPPFVFDSTAFWATTRFSLPASEACEKTWHIGYRQRLMGTRASYVVTSLQLWRRAIDTADFTVRYPAEFEDIYISYAPDTRETLGDTILACFHFENWMPNRDFIIEWR